MPTTRFLSRFKAVLFAVVAGLLMCVATNVMADSTPTEFNNPALASRYEALTNELRCPKCENESLASSQAPIAGDIRNRIGEWLKAGETDDQIRQQLVARFGEYVLYKPRIENRTWLLWGFPGFAVILGILILGWFVMHRRRAKVTELDDSERARLSELLKRHSEHHDESEQSTSRRTH